MTTTDTTTIPRTTADALRLAARLVDDATAAGIEVRYVSTYADTLVILPHDDHDADALAAMLHLDPEPRGKYTAWSADIDGISVRVHRAEAVKAEAA